MVDKLVLDLGVSGFDFGKDFGIILTRIDLAEGTVEFEWKVDDAFEVDTDTVVREHNDRKIAKVEAWGVLLDKLFERFGGDLESEGIGSGDGIVGERKSDRIIAFGVGHVELSGMVLRIENDPGSVTSAEDTNRGLVRGCNGELGFAKFFGGKIEVAGGRGGDVIGLGAEVGARNFFAVGEVVSVEAEFVAVFVGEITLGELGHDTTITVNAGSLIENLQGIVASESLKNVARRIGDDLGIILEEGDSGVAGKVAFSMTSVFLGRVGDDGTDSITDTVFEVARVMTVNNVVSWLVIDDVDRKPVWGGFVDKIIVRASFAGGTVAVEGRVMMAELVGSDELKARIIEIARQDVDKGIRRSGLVEFGGLFAHNATELYKNTSGGLRELATSIGGESV